MKKTKKNGGRARFVRMFKPRFASMVENGTKLQTVRPRPKRMPKEGDTISLRCWTGSPYRSKQRVLLEAVIVGVRDVEIRDDCMGLDGEGLHHYEEEEFAMADGFNSPHEMREWFKETHGLPFKGIVIYWHPAPPKAGAIRAIGSRDSGPQQPAHRILQPSRT